MSIIRSHIERKKVYAGTFNQLEKTARMQIQKRARETQREDGEGESKGAKSCKRARRDVHDSIGSCDAW
jgi:hypothetical protein